MQNEDYRTIGQMLATIIIHGGEHPRIFSPAICSYITKGLEFCQPGIEEVPDPIVRDSLKKVVQYRIKPQAVTMFLPPKRKQYGDTGTLSLTHLPISGRIRAHCRLMS
jgi:hypothetical protein